METTLIEHPASAPSYVQHTEAGLVIKEGMPFETWLAGAPTYEMMFRKAPWWWGDYLIYGSKHYGEMHAQAVSGYTEGHVDNVVSVCERFPVERRQATLFFSHHKAAASLPPQEADRLLLQASREHWTLKDVSAKVSLYHEVNGTKPKRGRKKKGAIVHFKVNANVVSEPLTIDGRITVEKTPRTDKEVKLCEMTKQSANSEDSKEFASNGAAPNATESAPTPPPLHFAAIEVVDKERDGVISPKGETFEDINNFAHDPDVSFEDMQGALISLAIKHQALRNERAIEPAVPPASPEIILETATIARSMEPRDMDYDRSIHTNPDAAAWAAFFVKTIAEVGNRLTEEGNLEYTNLGIAKAALDEEYMIGWFANAMMAMHDHIGGKRQREESAKTPLQRAEEALLTFAAAAQEVNWEEVGGNALLRKKWLERLLLPCDEAIDKIMKAQQTPRK